MNPSASVSFQAPSLKKSNQSSRAKLHDGATTEEPTETDPPEENDFDEKKFDGIGLYDIDESGMGVSLRSTERSRHARHLSLREDSESSTSVFLNNLENDRKHARRALSDKQFQLLYGISRGSFEAQAHAGNTFSQPEGCDATSSQRF